MSSARRKDEKTHKNGYNVAAEMGTGSRTERFLCLAIQFYCVNCMRNATFRLIVLVVESLSCCWLPLHTLYVPFICTKIIYTVNRFTTHKKCAYLMISNSHSTESILYASAMYDVLQRGVLVKTYHFKGIFISCGLLLWHNCNSSEAKKWTVFIHFYFNIYF